MRRVEEEERDEDVEAQNAHTQKKTDTQYNSISRHFL